MNKVKIVATLLTVALMLGGCAKKEMVRSEETAASSVPAAGSTDSQSTAPAETPVSTPAVPDASSATSTDLSTSGALADQQKGLLETVYFDYDSFVLSASTRDALSRNAQTLMRKYTGMVRLEGHCDERGSDEYNLALGEKRAQSARSYLVTLGVAPERLSVISYGKERPAVQGSTEDAWGKNRRVEFVLTK